MARHGRRRAQSRRRDHGRAPIAEPRAARAHQQSANDGPTRPSESGPQQTIFGASRTARAEDFDPGRVLRTARSARGLSIEDLTRSTKIGSAVLLALEQNDVERLPAAIFTRGFLKAYAREVGLDPDATVNDYFDQLELRVPVSTIESVAPPTPQTVSHPTAIDEETARLLSIRQAHRFARLMTIAAVVSLVAYVWSFNRDSQAAEEVTGAQAVTADAAQVEGVIGPGTGPPSAAIDAALGPMQFELRPQGPCWLSAHVDGQPVLYKLLQPGDHQTIDVRDELVLRIGDPAALSFSINGKSGRSLGRAGEPVSVRITKTNYREFLSS